MGSMTIVEIEYKVIEEYLKIRINTQYGSLTPYAVMIYNIFWEVYTTKKGFFRFQRK